MFTFNQCSVLEMEYHDHNYSRNFQSPENGLQANVSQIRICSDGRSDVDSRRYQECSSHIIHERGIGQILWDQPRDADTFTDCGAYLISPNNEIQTLGNTYFYDVTTPNSACSIETQCIVRETDDLSYLRLHRDEKRYHEKSTTHHRPQKTIAKRKSRTVFNTQQILTLERIFKKKPYVNKEERLALMEILNVSDRVIKVWFQNRRRLSASHREIDSTSAYSDSSTDENDSTFNLRYVESKIRDADEFGYVTLDDRAMHELITVVDSFLSDIDLRETVQKLKVDVINTNCYEPISPVSINDNEDEASFMPQWEPNEPEVSLRHLFDVQALLST